MSNTPELQINFLLEQARTHPSMHPRDMIKLCYQAAFGAEHMLTDTAAAEKFFTAEFSSVTEGSPQLYESISPDSCRVNLFAWKQRGIPPEWLFRMFVSSAAMPSGTDEKLSALLQKAGALCAQGLLPFSLSEWEEETTAYRLHGGAVRRSERYREREKPAYRLVCARFIRLFPLLEMLAQLKPKDGAHILALDGRAASGKTTMAQQLSRILDAGVVHMDDFFLPKPLRTQNRLAQPGGNVHYERFVQEVLPNAVKTAAFSYHRFDCSAMDFGDTAEVCTSKWRIVEGAYSCHPHFGEYADIKAFSHVEPEEQLRRIERRNGAQAVKIFSERWIPLEENYFDALQIPQKADIIL